MPRMMTDDTMETGMVNGMQKFQFSSTRIDQLGATEYTLVTIAIDVTDSVDRFADDLRKCLITAVESCKKSPRRDNLLVRVILFSTSVGTQGIEEIHGFKPLAEIDPSKYPQFQPHGSTNLFDASFSSVGATNTYGGNLMRRDFLVNGIVFLITDGDDNSSTATMRMIAEEMKRGVQSEELESLLGILIGVNASQCSVVLDKFAKSCSLQFVDVGDVTPGKLAKLAQFVSQSVSSQSQSLGTGGPSQNIATTI